jgi:hypothetical protein
MTTGKPSTFNCHNCNALYQVVKVEAGPETSKSLILLVPGERIELPTNGLQNRCSTAELTRLTGRFRTGDRYERSDRPTPPRR